MRSISIGKQETDNLKPKPKPSVTSWHLAQEKHKAFAEQNGQSGMQNGF